MHTRGRKSDQRVAARDIRSLQELAALDRTDAEAGKIVILTGIKARHLRRLAPDQRTAGKPAALANTCDDGARRRQVELAAGKVIQKEQRLGALRQNVIDAPGDAIEA